MFGVDTSELLIVAVLALLFIGPKDLPRAMMMVGRWVGKVRGYARHFTAGIENVVREAELEEMEKTWRQENQRILAQYPADAVYPEPIPAAPDGAPMTALPEALPDERPADYEPSFSFEAPAAPDVDPRAFARSAAAMIGDIDDSKAPLLDHLIELRRRLLWCVATLAVAFFACLYFAKDIFAILVQPLLAAGQGKLIYTDVFEAFFAEVKVAMFAALMISFPVLATQIWRFVAPGMYAKEKRAFLPFLLITPFFFGGGAAFAYYLAMPWALEFLLGYQGDVGGINQEALPGVGNYLAFVTRFLFGFGVAFLMPVLLMVLERAGIVTREQLAASRRYALVGSAAVSAVLTPPDAISMLMMLVPLYALYEFAILAIRVTHWRRSRSGKRKDDTVKAAVAATLSDAVEGSNVDPKSPPGEGWRFRAHLIG